MSTHRQRSISLSDSLCGRSSIAAALAIFALTVPAFARQEAPPRSRQLSNVALEAVAVLVLESISPEARRKSDSISGKPGPLQIAEPRAVSISPDSHGTWLDLPNGARLWRLRIEAPGATDLNFGFGRYRLPEGATLHIVSGRESYYEGPYTRRDNRDHREFWSPVVPGDSAVLELYLPADSRSGFEIELSQVGVGYRDMFGGLKASRPGSCNIDIACKDAKNWRSEAQGVARYLISGAFLCSGSLINDARDSGRPFFLSAFHCDVNSANDQTVVVFWNFQSQRCGRLSGGSLSDNQSGARFIAGDFNLDGLLLELDEVPDARYGAYYNGWDRSGDTPQGAVAIHHPSGDEKAITFDDDPLVKCNALGLPNHWQTSWERGTTEPGSSGSPIFDPDTRQVVGFLTGGNAACDFQSGIDCYGPTDRFLDLPPVRRALGAKQDRPMSVDGLDSQCDCSSPDALVGSAQDDRLVGTSGDDIICGLEGDDVLEGKGGRDCLSGGPGNDNLKGGGGNDALHGGQDKDTCNGGKGQDSAGGCEKTKKLP